MNSQLDMHNLKVLLIDDDEDDYVNLRDFFHDITGTSYHLTWKSTYASGLEAIKQGGYDICLLDYRLGEHTGMDLLNEINVLDQACPIIFLTGQGDFEIDIQAMQMGAAEYLVKSQLSAHILERTVRYTVKHALDLQELKESKAQVIQQDRLASLGLLASSLAHEIGTPMGIIRSRAELVEKKGINNPNLKQDMQTVISQIDRITTLVNSLLNLAREKRSDHADRVSLNNVVKDVLNLMGCELERKGIRLQLSIPDEVTVKAEPGPLGQVLLNLMVNAVHGIEFKMKDQTTKDPGLISLTVILKDDYVDIVVQDTGCGISKENLGHLFKPFFTTKDIGSGSGLGLVTSLKLVQSWDGTITAASVVDVGSTFTVRLNNGVG